MDKPFKILRLLCILATICGGMSDSRAADDDANEADRQALRAAAADYVAALRRGDAEKLRTVWTPDGDYIDAQGQFFKAQDLLDQLSPASESAAEPGEDKPQESILRFIAPGVAIEDGATSYAVSEDGRGLVGRFTAVWVKRDGTWRLDSLREATAASSPGHPRLRDLDWLVGEWSAVAGDVAMLASWQWADSGHFLVGEFLLYGRKGELAGGTQRVGWDPVAGHAKSWTFSSHGGTGQGHWRREGDRWLVESTHVTGDGKKAKTTAIYTPVDANRFILEITGAWALSEVRAEGDALPRLRFDFRRAADDK